MTKCGIAVIASCLVIAGLQCTERSSVLFELPEPRTPVNAWLMVRDSRSYYDETLTITFDTVLLEERCCQISDSCSGLAVARVRVSTVSHDTVVLDMIADACPYVDNCGPYGTRYVLGHSFTLLDMSSICSGRRQLPYSTYNVRVQIVPDSYRDGS